MEAGNPKSNRTTFPRKALEESLLFTSRLQMALGIPRCGLHHSSLCLHGHLSPPPLLCIPQNALCFSLTRYVLSWLSYVKLFATLGSCNSMEYSLPASSVHGILQARVLDWVLPCSPPGDLSDLGIEPISLVAPARQADSLPLSQQGSPL